MAELPDRSRPQSTGSTRFPAVDPVTGARSLHRRRLDAQAAVDAARLLSFAARRELMAASASSTADAGQARRAADTATSQLRASVELLTTLGLRDGQDLTATLDVDIDVHPDGVTTVVRPHGDLDLLTSPRFEQVCIQQFDGEAPLGRLLVDMSELTFLDSSGLAVLVEIQRVCAENNSSFALTGPTERTRKLLQITRLDAVFAIV